MGGFCRSDEGAAPLSVIPVNGRDGTRPFLFLCHHPSSQAVQTRTLLFLLLATPSNLQGPTRPSRLRLRNENPPSPIEKHFALQRVSTNTVPAGLFKALMNDNTNNDATIAGEGEERRSRRALITDPDRWDVLTPLQEPPPPPRFPPRDEHAYTLFSDTSVHPQDLSRRLELHRAAGGGEAAASIKAAQLTHAELLAHTTAKAACIYLLKAEIKNRPRFGGFWADYEPIMARIAQSRAAPAPDGTSATAPAMTAACANNAEDLDRLLGAPSHHEFIFGRLMGLADALGYALARIFLAQTMQNEKPDRCSGDEDEDGKRGNTAVAETATATSRSQP
ncbi:hypothetical protein EDB86DRAFT_3195286 [Lactarius hatsudake]|nr:hypothetical protein EDB86DRAFT_3195286 [Lactarius hatsudake]